MRPGSVAVSHQSAMVLHGLPIWGLDLGCVHVTRVDGRSGGVVAGVQHHLGVLTDADLTVVHGRLATSVARAVLESACTTSFEVAVVGVDSARREDRLRAIGLTVVRTDWSDLDRPAETVASMLRTLHSRRRPA